MSLFSVSKNMSFYELHPVIYMQPWFKYVEISEHKILTESWIL